MDTNIYSKLNKHIYHSDVKNYPINLKIKAVLFNHLNEMDSYDKARPCVLPL